MKSLLVTTALLFSLFVQLINAEETTVVLNEDELIGTCTKTCTDIPFLSNKHGCKTITGCQTSRTGWIRYFVRCDHCACSCDKDIKRQTTKVIRSTIGIYEGDLYGTCTTTCHQYGLVRTNMKNCHEIRNCRHDRNGWSRIFWRCDYCTCECIVRTYVEKYRLENVKYDLSETFSEEQGSLITMAHTIIDNNSNQKQQATRILTFGVSSSTSITNSVELAVGLEVSVSAGVTVGVFTGGIDIITPLTTSYKYEAGKVKSDSKEHRISAQVTVRPKSSLEVLVVGHRFTVNVPYTATLVTEYENGSTSRKETTGVYTKVSLGKFRVTYGKSRPQK